MEAALRIIDFPSPVRIWIKWLWVKVQMYRRIPKLPGVSESGYCEDTLKLSWDRFHLGLKSLQDGYSSHQTWVCIQWMYQLGWQGSLPFHLLGRNEKKLALSYSIKQQFPLRAQIHAFVASGSRLKGTRTPCQSFEARAESAVLFWLERDPSIAVKIWDAIAGIVASGGFCFTSSFQIMVMTSLVSSEFATSYVGSKLLVTGNSSRYMLLPNSSKNAQPQSLARHGSRLLTIRMLYNLWTWAA